MHRAAVLQIYYNRIRKMAAACMLSSGTLLRAAAAPLLRARVLVCVEHIAYLRVRARVRACVRACVRAIRSKKNEVEAAEVSVSTSAADTDADETLDSAMVTRWCNGHLGSERAITPNGDMAEKLRWYRRCPGRPPPAATKEPSETQAPREC